MNFIYHATTIKTRIFGIRKQLLDNDASSQFKPTDKRTHRNKKKKRKRNTKVETVDFSTIEK